MRRFLICIFIAIWAGGCSAKLKQTIEFNPAEPLRVAVLPFYQVEKGKIISETFDPNYFIDNIPLLSSKLTESPPAIVQKIVESELSQSGLDLISRGYIDSQLGHHAFVINKVVQTENILAANPKELGDFLGADAILFGKVTRWDRSYYGLESAVTVGIELKLVKASDGKILFSADGEDSDHRGLSGIPTGFSSLVIEPLRGLDNEVILNLSQSLVKKMVKPLSVMDRPEYVNTSGPVIFGATDNAKGVVSESESLVVIALGTPDQEGFFSLDNVVSKVPMFEVDKGHYVGRFIPVGDEDVEIKRVVVNLRDNFGRTAQKEIDHQFLLKSAGR